MTSLPHRHLRLLALSLITSLGALASDVVLVRQIQKTPTKWTTQKIIDQYVDRVRRRLDAVGLITETVRDTGLDAESLSTARVAILPYNPGLPAPAVEQLVAFIKKGGKILSFYHMDARLQPLLGLEGTAFRGGKELPSLARVRFDPAVLPGAPESMGQASWNINEPKLLRGKGAKVAGTWLDSEEKDTGIVAMSHHPNGAYFAHIYLDEDPATGGRFFLALLGTYLPDLWQHAVEARLARLASFSDIRDMAALGQAVAAAGRQEADTAFAQAGRSRDEARRLLAEGKPAEALAAAEAAVTAAGDAFLLSRRSRQGELRGAWIHSAYGVRDWTWDQSIKVLADNGFNAIFVNMCWGAVAHYESKVLPVHPYIATRGDQIKLCLAACQKYGIELHVWKVNWNMGHYAPPGIKDKMVAAGRTQVELGGKPSEFLAPHLDENFELERDAMLEIVRKYPAVAGIHFDYIRYPNSRCDFSDSARDAFAKWLGQEVKDWPKSCASGGALRAKYNEWRRGNISRLVKAVSEGAHGIRPDIKVSAAVFGAWDSTPDSIAQDTVSWLEKGWLDFVCPMDYMDSNAGLARLVSMQEPLTPAGVPLYVGIGSWRHGTTARTAEQIDLVRRLGGDGFICFAHNTTFARRVLPDLAKGVTRGRVTGLMPHHSVAGDFTLPAPGDALGGAFRVGEELRFEMELPDTVRQIKPEVSILRDGYAVRLGERLQVKASRRGVRADVRPLEPGHYRLEVSGTWLGKKRKAQPQPFLTRSRSVRVISADQAEAFLAKQRPPVFRGTGGVRVGVWQDDAYGAAPILALLEQTPGLDAAPLWNLKREALAACQVVLLCQPRTGHQLFKEKDTARELARFVNRGGGLLTTHALVGVRGYLPPVPKVVEGGDRVAGATWRVKSYHQITAGIPRQRDFAATFADRISVKVGSRGRVVACTPEGIPIVAAGVSGKGRYVACGLGLGIGKGDRDVALSEAETSLLLGAVRWLGNVRQR
ncbi:MAG: family 10 glycosylhydrolase [Victivallales bacterium]|nr:family 10 glycosylhydrolase [Victivallales bacterium]